MTGFDKGYALVVGIASYRNFLQLPRTVLKDAEDVSSLLTDAAYCGYPKEQVKHLTDSQATVEGIREGLRWLAQQTSKNDTAVFFFSGHGGRLESGSQAGTYLIAIDSEPQQLQKTAIESAELTSLLQEIKAGRQLVLFDCCYAGGIGETKGALSPVLPEFKSGLDERLYTRLSEGQGRAIIASSSPDEVSLVYRNMQNSLFTYYLLRALRGEARTLADGLIRLFETFDFVSQKVTAHNSDQNPILKTNIQRNFPIALSQGGQNFVNTTSPSIKLMIENPRHISLPSQAKVILETMFATYESIVIEKEFGGGFGGGHVFLVTPIRTNNHPELPTVIKMGRVGLIDKEWQAFQKYIRHRIPKITRVEGKPVYPPQSTWGGLRYPLVGDGIFTIESLTDYCRHATIQDIRYVLAERLFKSLNESWKNNRLYPKLHLHRSYDTLLQVNLRLEPATPPANTTIYRLNPQSLSTTYAPGDYVELTGFRVTKVDQDNKTITLNLPLPSQNRLPASYRIRLHSVQDIAPYQENQAVGSVMAVVKETRQTQLQRQVQEALQRDIDLTTKSVTLPDGSSLPNPLVALPKILSDTLDVRVAYIHGDLNLENILVDKQSRTIQLIDFGSAREDYVLHDLLRLESEFTLHVLPEMMKNTALPPETIMVLYEQLHGTQQQSNSGSAPQGLEKAFAILQLIRQKAQDYLLDRNNWTEYYQGLTLYLLGALRFNNLDRESTGRMPKQIAFWGAATLQNLLEASPVSQETVTEVTEQEFRYDVYVSYVDQEPDETWVWDTLVPKLENANLRFAISGDAETPGMPRIVGIERTMKQSKRIMVVLSPAYLANKMADFQNVLAQTMAIDEDSYRLLPVKIKAINEELLPERLRMLGTINLIHPRRAKREFNRIMQTLREPLAERLIKEKR